MKQSKAVAFIAGIVIGMWGRWFLHPVYAALVIVAFFLGRHLHV